jgi:hypothetical protein
MSTAVDDPDIAPQKKSFSAADIFGLIAGLVPFALSFSESKTEYSNQTANGLEIGTRTTRHMDYIALGGGGVAILCAFIGLFMIGRMKSKPLRFVIFAVLLALGGFQIMRGALIEPGGSDSGVLLR